MDSELRNGLRRVASTMHNERRGIPFSQVELALGVTSFLFWVIWGKRGDNPYHFEAPNDSARSCAIEFSRFLDMPPMKGAICKAVPSFKGPKEMRLAQMRVYSWQPEWSQWELCLTRSLILITRAFVYAYTGILGETLGDYLGPCSLGDVMRETRQMLIEELGKPLADHLLPMDA